MAAAAVGVGAALVFVFQSTPTLPPPSRGGGRGYGGRPPRGSFRASRQTSGSPRNSEAPT